MLTQERLKSLLYYDREAEQCLDWNKCDSDNLTGKFLRENIKVGDF